MNITQANSSQTSLFGRAFPSEAIGKNIYEFAPQTAEKIFSEEILEAITKNEVTSIEWQGVSNADLWQTTIFPATDGLVMISRAVEFRKKNTEPKADTSTAKFITYLEPQS